MAPSDFHQSSQENNEEIVSTNSLKSLLTNIQHLKQELFTLRLDVNLLKNYTLQSFYTKLEELIHRLDVIGNAVLKLETVLERNNVQDNAEPVTIGYRNNQCVNGLDVPEIKKNGQDRRLILREREINFLSQTAAVSSLCSLEELEPIILMYYGRIQELLKAIQELRITNNGLGIIGGRMVGSSMKFVVATSNALEKDFQESLAQKFQALNLDHVEIGRAACQVREVLTTLIESSEILSRTVLAGGSVSEFSDQEPRDPSSDGEGSRSGYVTDLEEASPEAEDSHGGRSEDSATEDAQYLNTSLGAQFMNTTMDVQNLDTSLNVQHLDTSLNIQHMDTSNSVQLLNTTGVKEDFFDDSGYDDAYDRVERFLLDPTVENFNRLGNNAADVIDAHLQRTCELSSVSRQYACAALCASSLARHSAAAREVARTLLSRLICYATDMRWPVADALLAGLGLIKSECKEFKIRWSVGECYSCVAEVLEEPYFPTCVRDTLRYFIACKLPTLPVTVQREIHQHPALYSY